MSPRPFRHRLGMALVVAVAWMIVLFRLQTERTLVAQCTVTVIDKHGNPVEGVRVSQGWDAYAYDLSGGEDRRTNEAGIVAFPARVVKRSLLYWYFKPVVTRLNYGVHASSGIAAFINVSDSRASTPSGFSCADYECNDHPLNVTFELRIPPTGQEEKGVSLN